MKTKALLLSALILTPTAGAAAAQDFRVQQGKTLTASAQDFRVSYGSAALSTTPIIFAKSNLPQALSDEELDEVTGEFLQMIYFAGAACAANNTCRTSVGTVVLGAGGSALWDGVKWVYNQVTSP